MARCPLCRTVELQPAEFDDQLPVVECRLCGGAWLRANEYALWLKTHARETSAQPNFEAGSRVRVTDSDQAAACPDCGHFLRKYNVASAIPFKLDRCNHCNGVWLDRNEWDALRAAGLHDEINQMFTKPWQKHVQDEIMASRLEATYLQKFGAGDYEKIKEIRKWLEENPNRNMLLAYLLDKDPYGG